MPTPAPVAEIGYTQAPNYNWWLYDNETTPELIWPQSIYVYDQMRRTDAQVGSVLRAVTETLLRTPWRIDPAGARPRVVKFVADDLGLPIVGKKPTPPPRLKDRFSWSSHLREALLMLPHGHSYFEQVYRPTEDGSAMHLRKLAYRPAKTIERIDVASDGGLISIKQYWTQTVVTPQPIPVNHLVAYIHAKEGGNWLGTSILRNCYKNWLLKDRLLRVQAQTIERNGMGIPLYTAAETEESLAAGLGMATSWRAGEAAGSAVPFGASLKLVGVEGTLPDAQPVIDYHDSQIARAVLAHFLNLGQQTGSWALGTTFADFFTMSLQTLAEQIRDTATQHIVEDLVDINFGENEPAPRLVFDEIGSRQAATAQALKTLVDAGVIHPDEVLEETSRQQYGLPPADPATATPPPGQVGPTPAAPTQMGDTSPSVTASADPKDSGVEVEGLFDDEADDWEDAIDALILAFEELAAVRVEASAFDPWKHDRNPKGGAGGGRFRSMVDRFKDAIDSHGPGSKGHPLDEFDREQLRRVAKARGLTLQRGEPRDSIAEKLVNHLGPGAATTPKTAEAPKKATKTVKAPADQFAELKSMSKLDARDALDNMTRPEVYDLVKHLGERGASRHRKRELVDLVLSHHGGGESKPKVPETPAEPVRLTPEQQLARWRADAAKPGRIKLADSGPTKREAYVATWDRDIARTQREIANAQSAGIGWLLPSLQSRLDYETRSREAILTKHDPSLDTPEFGPKFKLAQKVDSDRPLAVYGDVLHIEGSDDSWNHANMAELELVPPSVHAVVAAHMAEKETGGLWIGDTAVTGMNHSHDLAGEQPRGWRDGRTFDDVNGVYRPEHRAALIGRTANSIHHGAATATHELGHALDHALGNPSQEPAWQAIHAKALAEPGLDPYFRQPGMAGFQELWAESFSAWADARHSSPGISKHLVYMGRLNVSIPFTREIDDYFEKLAGGLA